MFCYSNRKSNSYALGSGGVQAFNPSTRERQKQVDLCDFKASLVYRDFPVSQDCIMKLHPPPQPPNKVGNPSLKLLPRVLPPLCIYARLSPKDAILYPPPLCRALGILYVHPAWPKGVPARLLQGKHGLVILDFLGKCPVIPWIPAII